MSNERYPGIFVSYKKRSKLSSDSQNIGSSSSSEVDSEEMNVCNSNSASDCGLTVSDDCSGPDSDRKLCIDVSVHDELLPKRPKRKKNKEKQIEGDNLAIDPLRYKTKLCKNWQLYAKCPYGPRCLFAHGSKEMRSHTGNHVAISSAVQSNSPERQFYALGHFPSFMPIPFDSDISTEVVNDQCLDYSLNLCEQNGSRCCEQNVTCCEQQQQQANIHQIATTHMPYTPLVPEETCSSVQYHESPTSFNEMLPLPYYLPSPEQMQMHFPVHPYTMVHYQPLYPCFQNLPCEGY